MQNVGDRLGVYSCCIRIWSKVYLPAPEKREYTRHLQSSFKRLGLEYTFSNFEINATQSPLIDICKIREQTIRARNRRRAQCNID